MEREMGGELPNREEGDAEDGAANDEGGMPMTADPVVADWEGGEEPDGQCPCTQAEPCMGIDPE